MKNSYLIFSLTLSFLFAYLFRHSNAQNGHAAVELTIGAYSAAFGIVLNVVMTLIYCAFGTRISKNKNSIGWFHLQLILDAALLSDNVLLFAALTVSAFTIHIKISQRDVYQTIRPSHYFQVFRGFSILTAALVCIFVADLSILHGIADISAIPQLSETLGPITICLGVAILALIVGIFPLHFWIRPVFLAPTRYGLAAIMRLNIGFVFWCKFGFLLNIAFKELPLLIISLLTANLIYSVLLLFNEKKLSGIAASLYQWHVSLFLLGGLLVSPHEKIFALMDFFNTSICISSLMIIISMIRDRVGAERIDSATGLAISFPVFGLAFLFCVLSLIGFPGTIGFVSSEILLHCLSESYWPVAAFFVVALALNGYSCFRIFGDSFYGNPSLEYPAIFQAKAREKFALGCLVTVILIAGLNPDLIKSIFNYL